MWEEGFSFFCQGLRANNFLQHLDLRNNQINHQGAGELAMALAQNSSLQELGKSSLPTYTYMHANTPVSSISSNWLVSFLIPVSLECFAGFVQGEVTTPMAFGEWELNCKHELNLHTKNCVLGAQQSLVEEEVFSFFSVVAVGMPHD